MILTESDERRFWSKVALPNEQGCMLWLGCVQSNGYGRFGLRTGRIAYAHRVSYVIANGTIPEGLVLDHLCRVRHCVAPLHLEAVTQRENARRGLAGHHRKDNPRCAKGHPFAGDNLYVKPSGERRCRACTRRSERARYRVRSAG